MLAYRQAVEKLLELSPEFERAGRDWSPDLPNDVYGEFALYLRELIEQGDQNCRTEIRRGFDVINAIFVIGDESVVNLIWTGVLEVLTDSERTRSAAREMLAEKPREWFERLVATFASKA